MAILHDINKDCIKLKGFFILSDQLKFYSDSFSGTCFINPETLKEKQLLYTTEPKLDYFKDLSCDIN